MFLSTGNSGYKQLANLFAIFWASRVLIRKKHFKISQSEQFLHKHLQGTG